MFNLGVKKGRVDFDEQHEWLEPGSPKLGDFESARW